MQQTSVKTDHYMEEEKKQPEGAEKPEQEPDKEPDATKEEDQTPPKSDDESKVADLVKKLSIAERKLKRFEEAGKSEEDKPEEPKKPNSQPELSRDELKLIARGMEDEDIERIKLVAKEKGVNLLEAAKDDYVQDKIKAREKEEADKESSMPPSSATGVVGDKNPAEMTEDERIELYNQLAQKGLQGQS